MVGFRTLAGRSETSFCSADYTQSRLFSRYVLKYRVLWERHWPHSHWQQQSHCKSHRRAGDRLFPGESGAKKQGDKTGRASVKGRADKERIALAIADLGKDKGLALHI